MKLTTKSILLRMFAAMVFGMLAMAVAQAHFAFIVPERDGAKAKVVFSDTLDPDTKVNVEKIANTKLTLRDAAGRESPLEWSKGEGCYVVNVPGSGARVVYGTTDYGVLQKGEGKPFRLYYHSKAIVGDFGAASAGPIGDKVPLEILVAGDSTKLKFRIMAAGKPLSDAEATVLLPGAGKSAVKTDKDGFTPVFDQPGRYGVYARRTAATPGEHAGQKYDDVRHYATLVVDVGPVK
jgi:uncharacterized GH25 family protein